MVGVHGVVRPQFANIDVLRPDSRSLQKDIAEAPEFPRQASGSVICVTDHGRTASYLTAPVQIPACGTTARGSSKLLASHIERQHKVGYSEAVADAGSPEVECLYQLCKTFPVIAAPLTTTI